MTDESYLVSTPHSDYNKKTKTIKSQIGKWSIQRKENPKPINTKYSSSLVIKKYTFKHDTFHIHQTDMEFKVDNI